jgi:ubiquinone biosynthesis protein Coq4
MRDPKPGLTREAALRRLRESEAAPQPARWSCPIGPVTFRFPYFAWRRRAIRAHDLHHEMTGYPMTMRGEFQLAAWEMGAGRYPDWRATLMCAPLLVTGLCWSPRAMWRAYRAGRRSESLYTALDRESAG